MLSDLNIYVLHKRVKTVWLQRTWTCHSFSRVNARGKLNHKLLLGANWETWLWTQMLQTWLGAKHPQLFALGFCCNKELHHHPLPTHQASIQYCLDFRNNPQNFTSCCIISTNITCLVNECPLVHVWTMHSGTKNAAQETWPYSTVLTIKSQHHWKITHWPNTVYIVQINQ